MARGGSILGDGATNARSWDDIQKSVDGVTGGKPYTIYLNSDIDGSGKKDGIRIGGGRNIIIDLQGHTIDRKCTGADRKGHVIAVEKGGTLTLKDSGNESKGRITGGWCINGGGINNQGILTIEGVAITGNKSSGGDSSEGRGGGIMNYGTLTITDSVISGNEANFGGGVNNRGMLTIRDCHIEKNKATDGGGIYIDESGSADIIDTYITENETVYNTHPVQGDGGGIWTKSKRLFLSGCDVQKNICGRYGGAVYVDEGGIINLTGRCDISENVSKRVAARKVSERKMNLSLISTGDSPAKQAVIYAAGLKAGSDIWINNEGSTVRTALVKNITEPQTAYFKADAGELEFKIKGEKTEIFMATAMKPFKYAIYLILALEIIGACFVLIPIFRAKRNRKKGGSS